MKKLGIGLIGLLALLLSANILPATMPPLINDSIPDTGGSLLGNTVRLFGYSLSEYLLDHIAVVDLTTGETVAASSELVCANEGEGEGDGCMQSKCTLAITLERVVSGHEYEITFDETDIDLNNDHLRFFGSNEDPGEDIDLDGITDKQGDCDDSDAEIYPGAVERCDDTVDRDCDGSHNVCCEGGSGGDGGGGGCFIFAVP